MLEDLKKDATARMQKCVQAFQADLKKLRTGRAHPSLIEHLKVDYYGSDVPLQQVAGISIEAVPMYNLQRGPAAGQLFHTKGRGNGYIVTLGGKRVYFAGDTECTAEMKALKDIDVAFIPMNLPYTMPPSEAAACVKAFKPKIAIPYHYQGQKPEEFQAALKGSGIEVRLLNWYPAAGGN